MKPRVNANDFEKDIEQVNQIPAVANILEVICSTTGMGYAVVARVTEDRWIACAVNDKINFGLGIGGELKVETTLCHQVREFQETVAIDYVDEDPIYFDHHTPKTYGLQSYISIPLILKNGDFFGTLCAIDPRPALVNNEKTINMFKLFAELIAFNLDSIQTLSETEGKLLEEQKNAEIREQFIAMLGHDLRNPVNAISNAVQLLFRGSLNERNMRLAKVIQDSTIRTKGLIDNILDFASGRLGGGIKLNYENSEKLEDSLHQVITELRIVHPDKLIQTDFILDKEIKADYKRIAQLFSNLLGNAITHGEKQSPIIVKATTESNRFELCVINKGNKISPEAKKHLFKPFSRGKVHHGQEGLGLGLYIASEIADAHEGKIMVDSTEEQTCFTFHIPY
ncbi:signal transduction histidine kinase [Chryseobacterium ginsenosidimutans]|uniref:GAF domain-containing sensor histidine kinase n=1 Tax=Chryseobacterium ginsenosidimutans TaxID=687846 RepID=UPI002168DD6D|nr:GAF domain-containing sensor histidine kinase [Chryseobacterium ginsenosidimutans]MCS3869245.1 signal transduction histidine kinase [Chryseobacterium ginsenosidimutans]